MRQVKDYVYIRVKRDSPDIGYHIPGFIKEILDDGTFVVTFELYGRYEEAILTEQDIVTASDEVALGLKDY